MNQALPIRQLIILMLISALAVIGIQFLDQQHRQNMAPFISTPSQNDIFEQLFYH